MFVKVVIYELEGEKIRQILFDMWQKLTLGYCLKQMMSWLKN